MSDDAQWSFRSPLSLLERWRDRADGARLRELLVTGFTLDLGFLERFAVPTVRALGARITVLADAGQAVHDPVDVRRAGVAYQHGHAFCRGAFHPKLAVLLGDEDVWLAVGSGNPTTSGWGHNREVWLTVGSGLDRGPRLLHDVANWLVDLPTVVAVPSWIAATMREIAGRMRPAEVNEDWSSVRVVGNLRQSLLGHLPTDAVAELRLAAPFYDPEAAAVRALVDRMKPHAVRVAVQPAFGRFEGRSLLRATEPAVEREFRELAASPALHGKVVEWTTPAGVTSGLTGSANITAAALLRSTVQGGNCELAVLAPHPVSLFPEGDDRGEGAVAQLRAGRSTSATGSPAPTLLGCAVVEGALLVELAAPVTGRVVVEISHSGEPDTWQAVGVVPVAQATARFLLPEVAGGAVRVVVDVDGVRVESAAVFVTDPYRCRPVRDAVDGPRLGRGTPYEAIEVFTDPMLAARFTADLERLSGLLPPRRHTQPSTSDRQVVDVRTGTDRWRDYLEDCDRILGPDLSRLVFPHRPGTVDDTASGFVVDDVRENEPTDEEDAAGADTTTEKDPSADGDPLGVDRLSESERARYRDFATRWAEAVSTPAVEGDRTSLPPMSLRMLVASMYLTLLAEGMWRDDDWRTDLRWLAWALVPDDSALDELPAEAFAHLYAWLALVVATLREGARLHGSRDADALLTAAWRDAAEWVADTDLALAEELLLPAGHLFAVAASASALRETVELAHAAKHDSYAEARSAFAAAGLDVRLDGGVWRLDGVTGSPQRAAADVVTTVRLVSRRPVVAVARTGNRAVLVACDDRTMLLVDSRAVMWSVYDLSPLRTPLSLVADAGNGPPPGARTRRPLHTPPPQVRELGELLGVDLAATAAGLRS
ncbi:hypothetical protein GA0070609_4764 [Micromonospora echinaurantiaca]|uniref:Uncharacterized protein n=1 Tax=Micromonospora echinaurantiaca TaxID=47857 RepID=A0A1C5JQP6_9ACTN|nr:hypothetical protein [Micromonospora echinaurantiaca]SCG72838.1 hypothetical protein GA0070609_4764 [Micromonospora echinaurantiaca]